MAAFHFYLAPGDFWSQSLLQFSSKLSQIAVFVRNWRWHNRGSLEDGNLWFDCDHIRRVRGWIRSQLLERDLNSGRKPVHFLCREIARRSGFNAYFADGNCRFIRSDTDEAIIRRLITRIGPSIDASKLD